MRTSLRNLVSTLLSVIVFVLMAGKATIAISQTDTPTDLRIIHANSRTVQIKDGNHPVLNDWVLDPAIELDTYFSFRSDEKRKITFTTDVDSIAFDVEPDCEYDFVVMLKDGGACKTRISTKLRSFTRLGNVDSSKPLIIPISIEHGKLYLKGRVNNSDELNLVFDTGADSCLIYPSARAKGVSLQFTGTVLNAGTGGTVTRNVSDGNQLTIADAVWPCESFICVEKQADYGDGIVGFSVFSNKIVEIDYDRMQIVVHQRLPSYAGNYSEIPLIFSGSLPAVDVTMTSGDFSCKGPFILDTAGTSCMFVNQAFGCQYDLHGKLKNVGSGTAKGLGNQSIKLSQLMLPSLSIAGYTLLEVPIHVEVPSNGNQAEPGGVICMDVLERFNTILDFQAKRAYFQPNKHFSKAFRVRGRGPSVWITGLISSGLLIALAAIFYRVRFRRYQGRSQLSSTARG